MRLAILGSRTLTNINLDDYVQNNCSEIVSGGAKGIDKIAEEYAIKNNIKIKIFLPDYKRYGKGAPLKRNREIAEYADEAIVFWDGKSKGTKNAIDNFYLLNKKVKIIIL